MGALDKSKEKDLQILTPKCPTRHGPSHHPTESSTPGHRTLHSIQREITGRGQQTSCEASNTKHNTSLSEETNTFTKERFLRTKMTQHSQHRKKEMRFQETGRKAIEETEEKAMGAPWDRPRLGHSLEGPEVLSVQW